MTVEIKEYLKDAPLINLQRFFKRTRCSHQEQNVNLSEYDRLLKLGLKDIGKWTEVSLSSFAFSKKREF